MNIQMRTSIPDLNASPEVIYLRKEYLSAQQYSNLLLFENKDYFIPLNHHNSSAISLPKSPFGSFYKRTLFEPKSFNDFNTHLIQALKEKGIRELEIHHPSEIYSSFVSAEIIQKIGYQLLYTDINQHIALKENWESGIHKMQQRKLNSLREEGFEFRKISRAELKTAHQFLTVCRQTQGLEINISWDTLKRLDDALPNTYECFGIFRGDRISALCISVNVTEDIAYYYLPGTSPMFRSQSPMVLLIAGMVDYYYQKGFKVLDLGLSSHQGNPQETLRLFKERMGAIETNKPTFKKSL